MELVFYDKDERETDLLCEELKSYNITYKVKEHVKHSLFSCSSTYSIHANISYEFYDYIQDQVNKKLQALENLEKFYNLPSYNPLQPQDEQEVKEQKECNKSKMKETSNNSFKNDLYDALCNTFFNNVLPLKLKEENENGQIVQFQDLDQEEKDILLQKVPIKILTSPGCKIIKSEIGLTISYDSDLENE